MNTLQNRAVMANAGTDSVDPQDQKERPSSTMLTQQQQRQPHQERPSKATSVERSITSSKQQAEISSPTLQSWRDYSAYAVTLVQNQEERELALLWATQRLAETKHSLATKYLVSSEYAHTLASNKEERDKAIKQLHTRMLHEKNMFLKGKRTYFLVPAMVIIILWWNFGAIGSPTESEEFDVLLNPNDAANGVSVSRRMSGRMTSVVRADFANTVVDVISIGSLLKKDYHQAQLRTFVQHQSIRHFFPITEKNDTDAACYTELTTDQLDSIIDFCSNTDQESFISTTLRKNLFQPKRHTGWMCSQKRPLDGLYHVLEKYKNNEIAIPDYLFIIEEDTFLNIDSLLLDLLRNYPSDKPKAIAGCNRDFLKTSGITFPESGFGSYFTKAAIERFIAPFYCDGRDQQSTINCWRININALGEKAFYKDGMSVHDLMHAFSTAHQFAHVDKWSDSGFCMHADHALAYFTNFYHIPVPDNYLNKGEKPKDAIRRKNSFLGLQGRNQSECGNEQEDCTSKARICHEIDPAQMSRLYQEITRG